MKKKKQEEIFEEEPSDTRTYLIIGIVACVLSAVALGLAFTALGIYALICAILLSLAALAFINTQQKKNPLPACKIIKILAYVELFITLAIFVAGTIYSALAA